MSLIYKKRDGLSVKRLSDGSLKINSFYNINKTCKDIWNKIDGVRSINDITLDMSYKYNTPASEIKKDIEMLFDDFKKHNLIVEIW